MHFPETINVLELIAYTILGVITFFIRSYFNQIKVDIQEVGKTIAKLDGHLMSLQTEIRNNTVEITKAQTDVRALWRFIDNAHQRASDINNGE